MPCMNPQGGAGEVHVLAGCFVEGSVARSSLPGVSSSRLRARSVIRDGGVPGEVAVGPGDRSERILGVLECGVGEGGRASGWAPS